MWITVIVVVLAIAAAAYVMFTRGSSTLDEKTLRERHRNVEQEYDPRSSTARRRMTPRQLLVRGQLASISRVASASDSPLRRAAAAKLCAAFRAAPGSSAVSSSRSVLRTNVPRRPC